MLMNTALLGLWVVSAMEGSGTPRTESRTVPAFTRVNAGGAMEVVVTQGEAFRVEVTADDNLLMLVGTRVKDGTLMLGEDKPLRPRTPIKVAIAMPRVDGVELSGGGTMALRAVRGDALDTVLSGAGRLEADAMVTRWTARLSGAGRAVFKGRADDVDATLSGAGNLDAGSVTALRARVVVSGTGSATVSASQLLDATVSGVGSVTYGGNPKEVKRKVSGMGAIRAL
jgi:hypothetical protein